MTLVRRRGAVAAARSVVAGDPVTGGIAATLPALTQAVAGSVEVRADIAATLPALTQAATGTVPAAVTGDIAATLPALTQAATGTVPAAATLVASTTGTSDAVNAPTHVDGDVLVLFATDLSAVPSGWTGIGPLGDNPLRLVAAWKVASSEPASYNFGGSGQANVHAYRNVDTTDPIVAAERAETPSTSDTLTVPGVAVLANGIRVVGYGHATGFARTLNDPPAPFTTLHNSGSGTKSLTSGYVEETAGGTSADVTLTSTSASNAAGVHLSLRPTS